MKQRLTEFGQENALVIGNTLFQQHKQRPCTWTSPEGQHQNPIDSILSSQRWRNSIQSAKTRSGADCGSHDELLIAKFRLKFKKVGKTTSPFSSVSVMSNSLWPHELQHTRPPCPSHFSNFPPIIISSYMVWITETIFGMVILLMVIPWLNINPIIRNFLQIIPCAVEGDVYSSVPLGWNVLHICVWSTGCIVV